jgi:hypothetical protein
MKEEFKWDVKIGDKVDYFDPELSYEHTGYIPINMSQGLDFDSAPFTEVGRKKDDTGRYTTLPLRSKSHKDFWSVQHERCLKGYKVGKYRVTGDHYFFLNFYRLLNVKNVEVAGEGRDETMPDFWSKHYEYFHYVQLCETLLRDVISLKARGVGFSEIAASLGVGKYTIKPKYKVIYTAYADTYLQGDGVLQKVWNNLEFLNSETEGGMRRIRQKIDTIWHKKASKVDDKKTESGHMAEILGKVVDAPRKLRGGRYERIFFEESGSDPILITKWNQAEALVKILGKKIGTRFAWGTGGDEGPYLAALEEMFLNPKGFGGLPYKHRYNKKNEIVYTGFFVPAHACVTEFMDARGVTDEVAAKKWYEEQRLEKAGSPKNLLEFSSEYCFYPEEALSRQGDNQFNQARLADQYTEIEIHKTVEKPKIGRLFWTYKEGTNDVISGVRWQEDPNGDIFVSEFPQLDEHNQPMRNLYVGGVDGIDIGEDESVTKTGSKFAILIKKRTFGNTGNRYVCGYCKRPNDVREAYANAARILWWYGCKANLEDTKIGFRTWLREKKLDHRMIMNRPTYALAEGRRNDSLWGTPGSEKMIRHGLSLIADFIEDYCQNLNILEVIEQLQKYSYEFKGKFDWVSAMAMAEIGDEDMYDLKIIKDTSINDTWQDVGYYRDEDGILRRGIIPKKE